MPEFRGSATARNIRSPEFTTDACLEDGDPETLATFTDSVISFWMPPGNFVTYLLTVKLKWFISC